MKTSELIKKLKGLGFTVEESESYVHIVTGDSDMHYSKNISPSDDWAKVLPLLAEYYQTPLDERKTEKKYRLVLAGDDSNLCWIIGLMHSDLSDDLFDSYWAINNENYLKKKGYQTRFTDADLKKIADGDQDMLDRLTVLKREAPDDAD